MPGKIDAKTVDDLAELSRLKLTDEEKERIQRDLQVILAYMDQLAQVDTADVEPLSHSLPVENVFRADIVQPSQSRDELLANAPRQKDGCFAVPKTVG